EAAWRAAARAAVARAPGCRFEEVTGGFRLQPEVSHPCPPADRDCPCLEEGRCAGWPRAVETPSPRSGRLSAARGCARGLDAGPIVDLDAHPNQSAARPRRAPPRARET